MSTDVSESTGRVVITVYGPDGTVRTQRTVKNLITDAGDEYHARRIASAVAPAAPADATRVSGMKLGTGTAAVAKSGAGAALGAYVAGGRAPFDAGFPTTQSLGPGLGWTTTYQTTFPAGVGTSTALTEVAMVLDAGTDGASSAADTTARVVFPPTPKGASDTLAISWAHKQLGS